MFGHQSIEKLAHWQSRLEEQYVRLAMSIAQYEGEHDLAAFNDVHVQLDRLELDLARASRAIKLANKHLISREALDAAKQAHATPALEPEPV